MKLGLVSFQTGQRNLIIPPNDPERLSCLVHVDSIMASYPDEPFVRLDTDNFDPDVWNSLDLIIYMSGTHSDIEFIKIVDKVETPILCHLEGAEHDLPGFIYKAVERTKYIMDCSAVVSCADPEVSSFYSLFTDTPIYYWLFPYPVSRVIELLKLENDMPSYDILILYGPGATQNSPRNGYVNSLLAQKIVDTFEEFNTIGIMGSMDATKRNNEREFLHAIGCHDFTFYNHMNGIDFIQMLSNSKLAINLDRRRNTGRFAIDCAVARVPVVMSNQPPIARNIYGGMCTQDVFNIDVAMNTAMRVAEGRWPDCWLDLACDRAKWYDYENNNKWLEAIAGSVK